jgi:SAM-dependent methyltransferase
MKNTDAQFAGSVPDIYETQLVPMLFAPYAADLTRRLAPCVPGEGRVLEIAAGTGAVTRTLASALPERVAIVATDLNQAMLDRAALAGTSRPVEWRQADAMALPFPDASFDAVVCQFGVMFFPDKPKAFAEVKRVLAIGGAFLFNVWDRIEENEFADVVEGALAQLFPDDPPRFMSRTPHGYHDRATIERDLERGGFKVAVTFHTVAARSRAASARAVAVAYCQGTPGRNEIEARDAPRLGEATDAAEAALIRRFGTGEVEGKVQAHVIEVAGEEFWL